MYCQKCRNPLRVDASLDDLNPAAFDLLVGSSIKAQQNTAPSLRHNYPSERKDLYDRVSSNATAPLHRRAIPPPQSDDTAEHQGNKEQNGSTPAPDMSFIEITQSQVVVPDTKPGAGGQQKRAPSSQSGGVSNEESSGESLHAKVVKNEKLFAILSSHSDIDHPICAECTSLLLQSFTARLVSASKERDAYASFLKQLQQTAASLTDEDEEKARRELANLEEQDEQAYEELLQLEKNKAALEAEIADLEEESRQLDLEEEGFWASRNAFDDELHALNTDLASLQQKYAHDQQQLEKLQRTNVYNDTFCIGHDGYFGTINGLRLGKTPEKKVEWAEINAAWGQTLLLLATVAERLEYKFHEYQLKPLGSTSSIIKMEWPQQAPNASRLQSSSTKQAAKTGEPKLSTLPLYSSGENPLGRLGAGFREYDKALVAFLHCLSQVGDHVERTTTTAAEARPPLGRTLSSKTVASHRVLPYKIQGDKIGDVSIKLGMGFQPDENFTKACKYALTCCKFLLAHVSNLDNPKS